MTAIRPSAVLGVRGGTRVIGRAVGALLALTIAIDVAFLVGLVVTTGTGDPFVNVGLSLASQWIPVALFWLVAAGTGFRHFGVVAAAAAVTFSAIGDAYWTFAMNADGYLPFPSPADAGYLLFYPLMVVALILLVRRQLGGMSGLVLLETVVATVGASAVLAVVLDPVLGSALSGDSVIASAVAASYPLFDLILLAVIAGIAAAPTASIGRSRWALIAGLGVFAVADIAYAFLENDGAYVAGTPLDAAWAVGLGLIAWWVADTARPTDAAALLAPRRTLVLPLPAVAVLAGLTILVVGTQVQLSILAVVLAGLTVALGAVPIIFRQAMLGRMLAAQQEAVRRLTELDQAKTDMLTTVNHEFRTPLTSINGHVDLLLDGGGGDLPPGAVRMLETVERNGRRLQSLIDETFAASRFAETAPATRRAVAVAELVASGVERVALLATTRRVQVEVSVDPAIRVDGDPDGLSHALGHLLDNAVKFSSTPGRVSVTATSTGDEVVIRIADAGIGIPADDIPRVFEKFFRAANVQNAAIPGVGLGLSIARPIVAAHAGTIEVESVVGTGTTVTVRLPAARS